VGSFGTDKGIGADYASNNPAILFSDDDMIIRTGGTVGHGTIGAMYIASAEELIIGHTDASLTDATSLGAGNYTDYLQIDTNGIEMTTARGTVQFGYNLEAPGVPTHFHINKLNQSFDLFFGDDSNYFHLPAGAGSPVIGANDGSSGQKLWTFGQDGSLTLPQSNSGAALISAGTVGLEFTSNGHALQLGTDGTLIVPGDIKSVADTGDVVIHANNGTQRTWTFGGDGSLTVPQGGYITAPSAMGSNTVIQAPASNRALLQNNNGTNLIAADDQGVAMTTVRGTVQFGYNLEAPGVPSHFHINKLDQTFDLFFGDDANYFHLPASGGAPVIGAYGDSVQKLWTFGQDGGLIFPDSTVQTTAYTGGGSYTLPIATDSVLGGVTVAGQQTSGLNINTSTGVLQLTTGNNSAYGYLFKDGTSGNWDMASQIQNALSLQSNYMMFQPSTGSYVQGSTPWLSTLILDNDNGVSHNDVAGFFNNSNNTDSIGVLTTDPNVMIAMGGSLIIGSYNNPSAPTFPDAGNNYAANWLTGSGNPWTNDVTQYPLYSAALGLGTQGMLAVEGAIFAGGLITNQDIYMQNGTHLRFPDGSVQTTAYKVISLPPLTAWGTVVSFDNLSFSFDATTGSPGFNGGYGQGNGSYSTLIWTADLYQQLASPTNLTISSGGPVQYFNYNGPNLITEVALTPGDSFVLRIQDVDTNRVYQATFLASFKAADAGNEGKYGAITVERLV
jgi:hypothetical protein